MPNSGLSPWAHDIYQLKYAHEGETWPDTARRVATQVLTPYFPELVDEATQLITDLKFLPAGRYLYAVGRPVHQTQNCFLMRAEDSREGWATLLHNSVATLMTGGGVGVDYSDVRPYGAPIKGSGGTATGPISLMQMVNEAGRHIMQGGSRRSALWAGLHWSHVDVLDFIRIKEWSPEIRAMKDADFNAPAPMDGTNISVNLDDDFFEAMADHNHPHHDWASEVYWTAIESMLKTGEPGFSVNVGDQRRQTLRNPCCEVVSADDSDVCNLGSINIARIPTVEEFGRAVEVATAFLLAGTLYSSLPYPKVYEVRKKNRRLGLGLMGVHQWLIQRGKTYGPDHELAGWLDTYATSMPIANFYADRLGISRPIATRAMAPTGTISMLAGATSSLEPMYAVAYRRRFLRGEVWHAQYVIEPIAKELAESGINPDTIETSYDLAKDPERRIAMQAWFQQWVDQGISSTLNLPAYDDQQFDIKEFGTMLLGYLPKLRGMTVYPDGARAGQPLTPVPYAEAVEWEGVEFEDVGNARACVSGVCGA